MALKDLDAGLQAAIVALDIEDGRGTGETGKREFKSHYGMIQHILEMQQIIHDYIMYLFGDIFAFFPLLDIYVWLVYLGV